jgi:hypothetical protein
VNEPRKVGIRLRVVWLLDPLAIVAAAGPFDMVVTTATGESAFALALVLLLLGGFCTPFFASWALPAWCDPGYWRPIGAVIYGAGAILGFMLSIWHVYPGPRHTAEEVIGVAFAYGIGCLVFPLGYLVGRIVVVKPKGHSV